MNVPKVQRQWQTVRRGQPKDALKLVLDAPVPVPHKGEMLVKISHSAINLASLKITGSPVVYFRRGAAVPEIEASGWVIDPNGSVFKEGDEVIGGIGVSEHTFGVGTLSEYVVFKVKLSLSRAAHLLTSSRVSTSPTWSFQNHLRYRWRQHPLL